LRGHCFQVMTRRSGFFYKATPYRQLGEYVLRRRMNLGTTSFTGD
jgi:hypothetical protein